MYKIEDYWKFDTEKLIKDYPKNKEKLAELRESLQEITEVKTINYGSPPGTPGRGDSVPTIVADKEYKQAQINELEKMVDVYEKAYKRLNDEEKTIIYHWYHDPRWLHMPKQKANGEKMKFLMKKLKYESSAMYEHKNNAINKISRIIERLIS